MGVRNSIGIFSQIWAESGDRSIIADFSEGFGFEYQVDTAPDRRNMNDVLAKATAVCSDINKFGILPWDSGLVYSVDAFVVGSDGVLYKCLIQNGGQDPTSTVSYWTRFSITDEVYTLTAPSGGDLRTFNPNTATLGEIADVLATLINDLVETT